MIKKCAVVLLIVHACMLLWGCGFGIIGPKIEIGVSSVHSDGEIRAAMKAVQQQVAKEKAWTLTKLQYDEDVSEDQYRAREIANRKGAEAAIVLLCDFKTGPDEVGNFSPNKEYHDYTWTLCRYNGTWVIESRGYA